MVNWKAAFNPRSTTTEIYGADSWQGRRIAKQAAEKIEKADAGLGLRLTEAELIRLATGQSVPLSTITDVTVTAEPTQITGGLRIGPLATIGQRGDTFLTVTSSGPVWSFAIKRKRTP